MPIRFEIREPFASANYCHCTRCQRRTGTAASANGRTAPGSFHAPLGRGASARVGAGGRRGEGLLRSVRLGRLQSQRRRSARRSACGSGRSMPIPASGRSGGSTSPTPRPGRRSRTTDCRGTRKAERNACLAFLARRSRCVGRWNSTEVRAAGWSAASGARSAELGSAQREPTGQGCEARSRGPSSSDFIGGNSRRRLRPGETAAPERESLALLPSGPDAVRMLSVRGTRPSTPRARDLIPLKPPSDGVRSR